MLALALGGAGAALTGCDSKGPFEEAGEEIDECLEEAEDEIDDAFDDLNDELDDEFDDRD